MSNKKLDKERIVLKIRRHHKKNTKETSIDFIVQYNNNKQNLVNNMVLKAIKEIENLESNKKFTLKEVLGDIWDLFSDKVKRSVGKKFSRLVSENRFNNINVYKRKNNKTIYIKV